jgi:hypothetical protein
MLLEYHGTIYGHTTDFFGTLAIPSVLVRVHMYAIPWYVHVYVHVYIQILTISQKRLEIQALVHVYVLEYHGTKWCLHVRY